MLDLYLQNKKKVADNLLELINLASTKRIQAIGQNLRTKLAADLFSLVVVGQFKRGKTTFINALLAKDLLPTAIIPLTSIITILRYGSSLKIITFFENGSEQEIALEDLALYITEKYNPKNEKKVHRVEITYPSLYLKNGVQIIDTPGIASVHEHNTQTTYDYLPRADAAIFLVGVDPPLTQAELYFLRDLKGLISKTFFVQNKIDIVNIADREESLAFSKKIIEEEAGFKDIKIYPLSAREALVGKIENNPQKLKESGLLSFEQSLEKFLMNEKGEILLKSTISKVNSLINEELLLAELEEKSLSLPLQELENKLSSLKKFIEESAQEKIDGARLLVEEVKTLQNEILIEDIERLKVEKIKKLEKEIETLAREHRSDSNQQFIKLMNDSIDKQIRDIFSAWRQEEEESLKKHLQKILQRFATKMNKVIEQVTHFSAELLGVADRKFYTQEVLPPEIEFRFQTADETDMLGIIISIIRTALPKALAHKLILKKAQEKVEVMVDRHCGKVHYDFSRRMKQMVNDYRQNTTQIVDSVQAEVLNVLELTLANKKNTLVEISSQKTSVNTRINRLEGMRKTLKSINIVSK